jgi:hypothetical protein
MGPLDDFLAWLADFYAIFAEIHFVETRSHCEHIRRFNNGSNPARGNVIAIDLTSAPRFSPHLICFNQPRLIFHQSAPSGVWTLKFRIPDSAF